jgi:Mn-containing catalase
LRVDRLQVDLPTPKRADPNAGAALQELLGGKYGEMSTIGNYMFQSFNFRSKPKLRPFYSLVASITAEELGHVELVSNGVAMLNNGPDKKNGDDGDGGDISQAPFEDMKDIRLAAAFLSNGGGAVPVNSNGASWNNGFVTTTGNVIIDLLIYETSREIRGISTDLALPELRTMSLREVVELAVQRHRMAMGGEANI